MKRKFIKGITTLLAVTTILFVASCQSRLGSIGVDNSVDSTYVVKQIKAATNPSFYDVEDVLEYQNTLADEKNMDEIFLSMKSQVLRNVAGVCINKWNKVRKKDIVYEYLNNKQVYDNLPTTDKDSVATKTSVPLSNNVSIRHTTDTVDGKPVKVTIKEERTYEQ